jgi:hypothetical protein
VHSLSLCAASTNDRRGEDPEACGPVFVGLDDVTSHLTVASVRDPAKVKRSP